MGRGVAGRTKRYLAVWNSHPAAIIRIVDICLLFVAQTRKAKYVLAQHFICRAQEQREAMLRSVRVRNRVEIYSISKIKQEVIFMKKKKTTSLRRRDKLTKQLCVNAVMIALFFVLDFLAIRIGNNMKITFSGLPIIVSAIFYGPVAGMAVGFIGALLGQMATYGIGLTTIFWILPAAVRGLVVGLFAVCLKKKGIMYDVKFTNIFKAPKTTKRGLYRWFYDSVVWKAKIYPMLTMTVLVSSLIVTALNTIFLYPASKIDGYYHEGLITATLVWRIINSIITAFIYVIIIPKLLSGLNKALKK